MKKSFMERMAAFIVDKRRLFVVLFAVACVLSVFSVSKTDVNNELTDYLPDSTQTRQGLEIMNREFITYGVQRDIHAGGRACRDAARGRRRQECGV